MFLLGSITFVFAKLSMGLIVGVIKYGGLMYYIEEIEKRRYQGIDDPYRDKHEKRILEE